MLGAVKQWATQVKEEAQLMVFVKDALKRRESNLKTAGEIRIAVDSIRYYSNKIFEAGRKQLNEDAQLKSINALAGTTRFDSLGAIGAASRWIDTYCDNIESNLQSAVEQDKLLHKEDEAIQDRF